MHPDPGLPTRSFCDPLETSADVSLSTEQTPFSASQVYRYRLAPS